MSQHHPSEFPLEPERYEPRGNLPPSFDLDRRAVFRLAGPGGKPAFEFGQLTKGKKLVKVIDDKTPTTPPEKWAVAGTPLPKVDGAAFVTGAHRYASDVKRPGMLFGKVLRPPAFKAKMTS